jgi:hypothetical protein
LGDEIILAEVRVSGVLEARGVILTEFLEFNTLVVDESLLGFPLGVVNLLVFFVSIVCLAACLEPDELRDVVLGQYFWI